MHESNIEDPIRRDQARRQAELKLGEMIDAAEASGVSDRSPGEVGDEAERDATGGQGSAGPDLSHLDSISLNTLGKLAGERPTA